MASADFFQPIPKPLSFGSTVQVDRSPRLRHATFTLMPAAFTSVLSVHVSGFEDIGLLQPIPHDINLLFLYTLTFLNSIYPLDTLTLQESCKTFNGSYI
jgi:hypothetical protein